MKILLTADLRVLEGFNVEVNDAFRRTLEKGDHEDSYLIERAIGEVRHDKAQESYDNCQNIVDSNRFLRLGSGPVVEVITSEGFILKYKAVGGLPQGELWSRLQPQRIQ